MRTTSGRTPEMSGLFQIQHCSVGLRPAESTGSAAPSGRSAEPRFASCELTIGALSWNVPLLPDHRIWRATTLDEAWAKRFPKYSGTFARRLHPMFGREMKSGHKEQRWTTA